MISFKDYLLEKDSPGNTIVVFPGRFQPFHLGHRNYYLKAKKAFPQAHFYIATSNPTPAQLQKEPDRYPFSFDEKKKIMLAAGIPDNEIVLTAQPYKPVEILQKYNPLTDKVIFLVGEKDMKEDPRFGFKPLKSGAPSYFQPFTSLDTMTSFNPEGGHGYIYAPGTITFSIDGHQITSASELRNEFKLGDEKKRQRIIIDVVGRPNPEIYNLFSAKLR
jgi:cytidyltransferase-like protein